MQEQSTQYVLNWSFHLKHLNFLKLTVEMTLKTTILEPIHTNYVINFEYDQTILIFFLVNAMLCPFNWSKTFSSSSFD